MPGFRPAHRCGARVVTFDPDVLADGEELWSSLPPDMRSCIERRTMDSLQGMRAALQTGDAYESALLDSVHSAEQVWDEFELVTKLVCPRRLILIHDVELKTGTVKPALEWIARAGCGVTCLWCAERGVREEDKLGLAVVGEPKPGQLKTPVWAHSPAVL
jgi:hypothetical protein